MKRYQLSFQCWTTTHRTPYMQCESISEYLTAKDRIATLLRNGFEVFCNGVLINSIDDL